MKAAYWSTGSRKRSALENIALSNVSLGAIPEDAFRNILENLRKTVKLSYPKYGHVICIFSDPSGLSLDGL